jgi:two-component system phosphate regulon sensor histidine kinase PhoR
MHNQSIRNVLILGVLALAGIIFIQCYWVFNTWNEKDEQFNLTTRIALKRVATRIAAFNKSELPRQGIIQRKSSNYYAVNINDAIHPGVLESYLIEELGNNLDTDFEYAVYDCENQDLIYGNYCRLNDDDTREFSRSTELPEINDLTYYFVVKFPEKASYLLWGMWTAILFSLIALLAVIFFVYSIWIILKQRRLSEMQRDFINNMTHEFKTPIASIKIASDVLSTQDAISDDNRLSQYINIIKDQNARLNKQVERVLSIAKLEKENYQLRKETFNLSLVLDDIASNENVRLVQGLGGEIVTDIVDQSIPVFADKVHLTNCIYSLLDNAIKYCKQVPDILIKVRQKGNNIILEIADNGIGIKEDHIPKLFNKFYRVPTGNIHDVKGFGLGLFYVKNICRAHNWTINVDSEIGNGTCITLNIPSNE